MCKSNNCKKVTLDRPTFNGHQPYILSLLAWPLWGALLALACLYFLVGCGQAQTEPQKTDIPGLDSPVKTTNGVYVQPVDSNGFFSNVSIRYIDEDDNKRDSACWYPTKLDPQKDSLYVEGKRYTISSRSRYRLTTVPSAQDDVIAEGPITENDWGYYLDTKVDSIYAINKCGGY